MGVIKNKLIDEIKTLTNDINVLSDNIEKNNDRGVTNSPYDQRSIKEKQKRLEEINKLLLSLNLP
jgi:hypothetical protein